MKIAIYTLGCKVNQYETQAMESYLRDKGHKLVPFEKTADAYIINTCAVTAVSGHKSRQMIRQARKRNPGAVVAVCGQAKYKGRLSIAAGESPSIQLKLRPGGDPLESAMELVEDLRLAQAPQGQE